jgi:putative SOS response-associated peptidase YedK
MCNRYRLTANRADLATTFGITLPFAEDLALPAPDLFPKRPALVVRAEGGDRRFDVMSWGFPHTITGRSGKPIQKPVTNVRNYTSPFWRSALANPARRCLVPFTAFSEYGPGQPGHMPLHWFAIPSQPIACFAGVWRPLGDADGTEQGKAYAFLTCAPNPLVGAVHPKAMPVLLHPEDYARWLEAPIADAIELAVPFPSQLMTTETASPSDRSPSLI